MPAARDPRLLTSKGREELQQVLRNPRFECIIVHDRGFVVFVNSAVEALLGYSPAGLIGVNLRDIAAEPESEEAHRRFDNGAQGRFSWLAKHHAGTQVLLEAYTEPIALDAQRYSVLHCHQKFNHDDPEARPINGNQELERLKVALQRKDEALKEFLWQLRDRRQQIATDIRSNIDRVVKPLLRSLEERVQDTDRESIWLITRCLDDLTSPFVGAVASKYASLTPRELEICTLIRSGLRSKEIAARLYTSVQTVLTQRKTIRRKLNIANKSINLATYLKSLDAG